MNIRDDDQNMKYAGEPSIGRPVPAINFEPSEPRPPETDPDYLRRMATPGPDDVAAAEFQKAAPPSWMPQPRPIHDQLRFVLDTAELTERQAEESAARELVYRNEQARLRGGNRRRQVLRSIVMRIAKDLGGDDTRLAGAVLADFDSTLPDDHSLGQEPAGGNVRLALNRPGWADIEITVAFDDASEPAAHHTLREWHVYPRELNRMRNSNGVVHMARAEKWATFDNFAAACLNAKRFGHDAIDVALHAHRKGEEVRWP